MSTPILSHRFVAEIEGIPPYAIQRLWFTKAAEPYGGGLSGGSIRVELHATKEDGVELCIQELCKKKSIKDVVIRVMDELGVTVRTYTLNHSSLKNVLMPTFDYNSSHPLSWSINVTYKKLIIT